MWSSPTEGVAADSLAPRRVGELVFPIVQRYVAQIVLVTDTAIRDAQRSLWEVGRIVAEPGGSAAVAALTATAGERIAAIISGGNTNEFAFLQTDASVREDNAAKN